MAMPPPQIRSPLRTPQRRPNSVILPKPSPRSKSRQSTATGSRASDDDFKTAVKVAIRVRPPLTLEDPGYDLIPQRFRASTCEVDTPSSIAVQSSQGKKVFVFDRVFDEQVEQEGVWSYISDSVDSFIQGYNVSVLAYGQSGAGKSYTMGTSDPEDRSAAADHGIIPRAAAALFEKLTSSPALSSGLRTPQRYSTFGLQTPTKQGQTSEKPWQLKATYVEIYNEQLRDLLLDTSIPQHERPVVSIREDAKGRILLTGLRQVDINSVQDLLDVLHFGSSIRQTDCTAINAQSSRSHAIFSLNLVRTKPSVPSILERRRSAPIDSLTSLDSTITVDSKLHFVDLAGSERLKNTGAQGEKAKEGISINGGLASLGKVIAQLSSRNHVAHVSYRDSKLTRMLQDSLGGIAITYMIACINPVEFHLSETLNTLHYAQRARAIQSKPEIQQAMSESDRIAQIDRLKAEITFLREQVSQSTSQHSRSTSLESSEHKTLSLQNQLIDMQESYHALSQRHERMIAELGRSSSGELMPIPENLFQGAASDRLQRSSSFANAVETVVAEYEKTIQSLESSLNNTRSTLSNTESDLMERESRIAYLEAATRQFQDKIQKMVDQEQHTTQYLQELESKLETVASNKDSSATLVSSLRKELKHAKENQASTEDYIEALEQRLVEAEQTQAFMGHELERLDEVIERQRNLARPGSRDTDLVSERQTDRAVVVPNGHVSSNGDNRTSRPSTSRTSSGAIHDMSPPSPLESDDEDYFISASSTHDPVSPMEDSEPWPGHPDHAYALEQQLLHEKEVERSSFMADKVETLTQELFDLRGEHETAMNDLEDLRRKYANALHSLSKHHSDTPPRSESFLGQSTPERSLQYSSSESLSRSEQDRSVGLDKSTAKTLHRRSSAQSDQQLEELHSDEMPMPLSEDQEHSELLKNHEVLIASHQAALIEVDLLKAELQRLHNERSPSPVVRSPLVRRKPSQDLITSMNSIQADRANRSCALLRNIALDHFESNPDVRQNFEMQLDAIMGDLHTRTERAHELEAEMSTLRSKLEEKTTIITGLTRERSKMQGSSAVDFEGVARMQDQLQESKQQVQMLQESYTADEHRLQAEIASLTNRLREIETTQGSTNASADSEIAKHVATNAQLQTQLEKLQAAASEHEVALAALRQTHQSEVGQLRTSKERSDERQLALQEGYEEAVEKLEKQLKQHQEKSRALFITLSDTLGRSVDHDSLKSHVQELVRSKRGLEERDIQSQGETKGRMDSLVLESQEASNSKKALEKELETSQARIAYLEEQLEELRRRSNTSTNQSYNDALSPEAAAVALARSSSASSTTMRRTESPHGLPSPPPVIPLPPLPTSPALSSINSFERTQARPMSPPRLMSPDPSLIRQLEESETRVRAVEKHLYAEKQLTATLEEALVDLETAQAKTRTDMDMWRRKVASLEEEVAGLRRHERASVQVEEEREQRLRAEQVARRQLEEQMRGLEKRKRSSRLNCF